MDRESRRNTERQRTVDWERVDTHDVDGVIALLDAVTAGVAGLRRRMQHLLDLTVGSHALDVGCGTGDTTRDLTAQVGTLGAVVGVDRSARLLEEAAARARREDSGACFVDADAHGLPFRDATFDACRVERTLQHVRDPAVVVGEMARVLRPAGRMVAMEPDWGGMMVDHPDRELTRRIVTIVGDAIRHPWIGRRLFAMFKDAGLADVTVESVGVVSGFVWFSTSRALQSAAQRGDLSQSELHGWLRDGERADQEGRFCCVNPVFIVAGTKRAE